MSVFHENMLIGSSGQGGAAAGYQISRSIRLNSADSAFLSRTPGSSGNRRTWTWAGWVKRTVIGETQALLGNYTDGSNFSAIRISNDYVQFVNTGSGGTNPNVTTPNLLRDPSAWYHIVFALDTTQATSSNRVRVYINGVQLTTSGTYPDQNADLRVNTASLQQNLGAFDNSGGTGLNGYLADIHFIDGQALDPTSFGEFDTNGVWQPIAYSGSYGTNGFHLDFADNSSAAALGTDTSGNSNTWTVNNISVAAGAGNDSLVDTPTNGSQTDTGVGGEVVGNYCTWNPLEKDATTVLSNGNLNAASIPGGAWLGATFAAASGKWYYEITTVTGQFLMLGVADYAVAQNSKKEYTNTGTYYYYGSNGQLRVNGVNTAFPDSNTYTFANNDVIGVAFDCDAGTVNFYRNGSKVGGASNSITGLSGKLLGPALSAGSGSQECIINAGQRPFAYTAPSGFKALCTTNLPTPTIADPSTVMDVKLYTGNGSTQTISGLGFSPDLVWLKGRSDPDRHGIYDIVRGATKRLQSSETSAEDTQNGVTAFNSDGFDIGNHAETNGSGRTYVAWAWEAGSSTVSNDAGSITSQVRANASAGFSIVTYTGTGANATVGHGLGVAPQMIIVKSRNSVTNWGVGHSSIGWGNALRLNTTDGSSAQATFWNSTAPTSTVFSIGTGPSTNNSGDGIVAYCFAPVAGYSSFGSYTGNGSTDGPFIYTGFRPAFIIIKITSTTSHWVMFDSKRSGYNAETNALAPSSSQSENYYVATPSLDLLSNGFKFRTSSGYVNFSGASYIWAAWAEHPFQYARAR